MSSFFARSLIATAALASLHAAHSQTLAQAAPSLTEVTIIAPTLTTQGGLAPTDSLSGNALTQRQSTTLGETLDGLPGVANASFGPNVGRPTVRGLEGDRVRLLQNGGLSFDVSGASPDHAVPLDPLSTERIEVLRGPAALLRGGSPLGGVINVVDNRIARVNPFDAKGGVIGRVAARAGGAASERSQAVLLETGNDRYALHIDAFNRQAGDLRVPRNMACDGTPNGRRVCNSANDTQGGAIGGTLFGDRGYVGFSSSDYRSTYGTVAEPHVTIGMQRQQNHLESWIRNPGWGQSLKVQVGYTRYAHTEFESGSPGTRFANQGLDARLEWRDHDRPLANGWVHESLWGFDHERNELVADGAEKFLGPMQTSRQSVFTFHGLRTAWGQLNAAARGETVRTALLENFGPSLAQVKRDQPWSFSLGAVRNLRQGQPAYGWQHSITLSQSQRAPKDYERFAFGQHIATAAFEQGNPNLGLEKGRQLELGTEWVGGPHRWAFTAYQADFSNFISLQPQGQMQDDLPLYAYSGVRARMIGWESSARLRLRGGAAAILSPDAQSGPMDLEFRADQVRADDLTHRQPLPRIAPTRVAADLVWSPGRGQLRVGFQHVAAQRRVPATAEGPGIVTGSYTLWNAAWLQPWRYGASQGQWFARLDNLTNELAYASTSILTQTLGVNAPPLPARSLRVGLQASF
jgi:iron complex outermembrane receptor protein